MKKILSLVITAGLVFSGYAALSASAASDIPADAATYCFDNGSRLSDWELFGNHSGAGVRLEINTGKKESGNGSLAIWQTLRNPITDNTSGGVQITADKLGLEDFAGCSMQISYHYGENPDVIDNFGLFSNGIVWISADAPAPSGKPRWLTATLTVPDNARNTIFGFTIPTFTPYNGVTMYIDNVIIFDKDGNAIANLGDYQRETNAPGITGAAWWVNILLIILMLTLVAVIVAAIGYAVKLHAKRYK